MSAQGHATAADTDAAHHDHYEGIPADRAGPDEPRTPLWLPLVGISLLLVAMLAFLVTRPGENGRRAREGSVARAVRCGCAGCATRATHAAGYGGHESAHSQLTAARRVRARSGARHSRTTSPRSARECRSSRSRSADGSPASRTRNGAHGESAPRHARPRSLTISKRTRGAHDGFVPTATTISHGPSKPAGPSNFARAAATSSQASLRPVSSKPESI